MTPNPAQREAIRRMLRSAMPVVWAGSIRSGKTIGCSMAFILHASARSGQYIVAGKSATSVFRNVIVPMMAVCKAWRVPSKLVRSEHKLRVGRSDMLIFGAPNEASQDFLQGLTADGFLLDELPLLPKSFLMQAIARCSVEDALMVATMNKTNPNHWVKTDVIDSGEVMLIESTLDDNPHIGEQVKSRYRKLLTGHYGARMLDNEWAAATGRIWPELLAVEGKFQVDGCVVAMDAAQSGTTAALRFSLHDGRWIINGEYHYRGERPFEAHAAQIASWKPSLVIVDPSAPGLIAALRRANLSAIPADNRVIEGIHTTETAIRNGKVAVLRGAAPHLLREMEGYVWDEKAALEGEDKPAKIEDHFCDCLRYFCALKLPMMSLAPTKKGKSL